MKYKILGVLAVLISMQANAGYMVESSYDHNYACSTEVVDPIGGTYSTNYNSFSGAYTNGVSGRGNFPSVAAAKAAIDACRPGTTLTNLGPIYGAGPGDVWEYHVPGSPFLTNFLILSNGEPDQPPEDDYTCWDGSLAANEESCPSSVICWDGEQEYTEEDCAPHVVCWDNTWAESEEWCPPSYTCWDGAVVAGPDWCEQQPVDPEQDCEESSGPISQLFCAADVSTIQEAILGLFLIIVTVLLTFVGIKIIRRATNQVK